MRGFYRPHLQEHQIPHLFKKTVMFYQPLPEEDLRHELHHFHYSSSKKSCRLIWNHSSDKVGPSKKTPWLKGAFH